MRTKKPQPLFTHYLDKTASVKKGSKKSKQKHMILEIYSNHYYKSKIQGLVNDELDNDLQYKSLPRTKKVSLQLSVYRCIHADCWENESDEVRAEIMKIFNENHAKDDEGDKVNVDGSDSETENNDNDHNDDDDEKTSLQAQQE